MAAQSLNSGSWTYLKGVDFDKIPTQFLAKVKGNGKIEVRLDDVNADAVASIEFSSSNWQVVRNQISETISGTHDVYFVFSGADISLESWQFSDIVEEEVSVSPSVSPSASEPAVTTDPVITNDPIVTTEPAVTTSPTATSDYSDIVDVKVNAQYSSSITQNYTITPKNGATIDLSKLKIRFHYTKTGDTEQAFWCDTATCQLPVSPYYTCITQYVIGTFGNGYVEIGFTDSFKLSQGYLTMNIRFNQTNWIAYTGFAAGCYEVIYDGTVVANI